jgi:carbon-monoxide dehydrogenase medium subunit
MKPAPFDYVCPETLEEALSLLARAGGEAKVIAGGQSLIPAMNFRIFQPKALIDLNRIPELSFVRQENGAGLRLGAMTRQRTLERDPNIRISAPLIHEAMPHVAHPQIRNRGTFGGSLAHADPAAELPAILVALQGRLRAVRAGSERWIEAEAFFLGMFATSLGPDEILAEVAIPPLAARTGTAFLEVARRRGDYALAGLASTLTLDAGGTCLGARLVYLNAGDSPRTAPRAAALLAGQRPTPGLFEAVAELATSELEPPGTLQASPAFQLHLARVLTRRALAQAHERAEERER